MNEQTRYQEVCSKLNYDLGLVENINQAHSPVQRQIFSETKRQITDLDALYFSGDIPIIYFKLLSDFDEETVKALHRRIWNQNRVPLLYVVTPSELRIYNCFEAPAEPGKEYPLDTQDRLVKQFNLAEKTLEDFDEFSKSQIASGAFWKSKIGRHFRTDRRVDQRLLEELRTTRDRLHSEHKLAYHYIHNLLGRSIFILYLEDRGAIKKDYYARFLSGTKSYIDILENKEATYSMFDHLEDRFNGDLFPVEDERQFVEENHLAQIRELFSGTYMVTGQRVLWRPYDFGVIPIEFISAIYEQFLYKEEGKDYTAELGAYYTPHPLVEFILNEVLPWPSERDSRYELKILDPACGSGIFLVEAFRRLVARWMFSHNSNKIPHEKLKEILTEYIYGIDINPDAIRVAAFSLYLALLDYLKPKTIWEKFRFPHLVYDLDNIKSDGKNLFPMDVFPKEPSDKLPFESSDYDIVVGNPPWKRRKLPKHITDYCQSREFAPEMAQAFLWRVRDFTTDGLVALVATSKILFNIRQGDRNFRHQMFSNNYVETVVNFSALRKIRGGAGRQLFASAVGPASVFIYRPNTPEQENPTILYCTPKPTRLDNALPGITIDASEIKFIPRKKCQTSDVIWKTAMWGTQRDLEIVEKLLGINSISDHIEDYQKDGWHQGRGFQPTGKTSYLYEDMENMLSIPTRSIRRYWFDKKKLQKIGKKWLYWSGVKAAYNQPHILIKEGQYNKRFCAAFADFDCAFKYAVFGISGPDAQILKALTGYLNSTFASYFLFLTASRWGVEREGVYPTEVLTLPGIPFQMSDEVVTKLAQKVDKIRSLLSEGVVEEDERIRGLEFEIDELILDALDLSKSERYLIDDVLEYSLGFFQDREDSSACEPITDIDIETYAQTFCDTVNSILQFGQLRAWATVYSGKSPLRLVSIHFNRAKDAGTVKKQSSSTKLEEALANLERKIQTEYSESIYVRRNIRFYDGDTLHITKPDEKRFWSRSMALRDADETLAEGIHGAE